MSLADRIHIKQANLGPFSCPDQEERGGGGPDPLDNHKATKLAFNVVPSSASQ